MEGEYSMLAGKATSLVREVKQNLRELMADWREVQEDFSTTEDEQLPALPSKSQHQQQSPTVTVHSGDLERLTTETMMLKEFLPKLLTPELLGTLGKLTKKEQELHLLSKEREESVKKLEHLKKRNEALKSDYEQEKQAKFNCKCEVKDLQQQLSQQADYCTSMGAACCTLLWRVSRQEECIHSILSGSKVSEFLQLGATTLQSYLDTYTDSLPEEGSLESQFVLALCGTITSKDARREGMKLLIPVLSVCALDVAASAYGRDFLSSCEEGLGLVDAFCNALTEAPAGPECSKLRRLILMTLYNISINEKGLRYLISKPNFMRVLAWRLKEEPDTVNRIHTMRVLQSLIMEPESVHVVHQALEAIPLPLLEHLTEDPNQEVRDTALELISDLNTIRSLKFQH